VRRFAVVSRRLGVAVDLDENESIRVLGILQNIEPDDPRLLNAVARIFKRSCPERLVALA